MEADILGRSFGRRSLVYSNRTAPNQPAWRAEKPARWRTLVGETLRPPGPDPSLSAFSDAAFYRECSCVPWRALHGRLTVATADASPTNLARIKARYGPALGVLRISKQRFVAALQERFAREFLDEARCGLERRYPEFSARRLLSRAQICAFATVAALLALAVIASAPLMSTVVLCLLTAAYLGNVLFRAVLVWLGAAPVERCLSLVADGTSELPLYSIIVPLYREAAVVPALIDALLALDYPAGRLECALVLEEDDAETIAAVEAHQLDERFFVLKVPEGRPRTKPKAASYALGFIRGEFTVIYDAEDRPEPDQMKKALAHFRASAKTVACLQARLNFYNSKECWLTRMFALDYGLWFDFLLPGLDRLGTPMPLGGTSNHFRTEALRAIAGWDPYNVTEDADLGVRLAQLGLRVRTLDSTTFEEAPIEFGNWLRQRSRWMKGYMQTWLVHMRSPVRLLRHAGLGGFLGFQLFVGGTFLTALLNPVLWAVFLWSRLSGPLPHAEILPVPFASFPLLGLIIGNAVFAYFAMLGSYRRGWLELIPYGITAPVYWLLISAASYRGLWQLITRPWHWEKTHHGRTRQACVGADAAAE